MDLSILYIRFVVFILGVKKALAMAVKDTKSSNRYSKLKDWLQQSFY
tara:strand:+ start:410 stop:550 length:141 start_codon:yes stop_codon:yes gene_type:complete